MTRHTILRVCTKAIIILALGACSQVDAQTLRSVVEARARLFPSVGPGVTAVKRDASGRYYILGKPANVVTIYDSGGNLIGQIPNQKSGVSIRYAVGIDLTPDGKLVVADRGANAIEAFDTDGSLIAKIPVLAPTSVVALPGGLFAVTSLSSEHLVQILDESGSVVRSFGNASDVEDAPPSATESEAARRPLVDWGKIVGSSDGDIYFAFTSLPEPLVRRYDQYGAAGYEASVPEELSDQLSGPSSKQDRVEFSVNFSHLSLSDQTVGSVTVGSSGDVKFTGGMGTGLSRIMGGGGSFGRAAGQASLMQAGNGGVAGGMTPGSIGGMFSGQISKQGAQIQLGAGNISSLRGGRGRRGGNLNGNFDYDLAPPQGSTLRFFGSSTNNTGSNNNAESGGNTDPNNTDPNDTGSNGGTDGFSTQELAYTGSDSSGSDLSGSGSALQSGSIDESSLFPNATDAAEASSLSAAFAYGALFNSAGFSPAGGGRLGGGFGRFPGGGIGHGGFGGGDREHFQGNAFGDGQFRPHRFGAGEGDITATVRVNLGDLGNSAAAEKATITASAVDASGDLWVAVGDALVHYSKDGIALDAYYLALKGGEPLKPTALEIEPDRFIVAADPWGIFEFSRTPQ